MAIRVFDTSTGAMFTFPITPQEVGLSYAGKFVEFNLMGSGDAKIPNGSGLTEISFSGLLPGPKRGASPLIIDPVAPTVAMALFDKWRKNGTKLRLMIDGSEFNDAVYLQSFRPTLAGGFGDVMYEVSFIIARDLIVYTTAYNGSGRPESTTAARVTYTTKTGETLYGIAKKVYGDGKKWSKIYAANTNLIKNKGQKLPGGLVLVIPA